MESKEPDRSMMIELHRAWFDQMRATDEISLKLLAIVPTVTGGAIALLLPRGPDARLGAAQALAIGLFGAWVSFFVYRWERRNIVTCRWYRDRIIKIEKAHFDVASMLACDEDGQGRRRTVKELCEFPAAPGIFKNFLPIGKERAEFWVYFAVVVAWIAFALYGARLMIWPN